MVACEEHEVEKALLASESRRRAVQILVDNSGGLMAKEFARLMWPDSSGWNRYAKCGPSGVSKGGGMKLAAGGLLGKMSKAGLVYDRHTGHRGYVRVWRATLVAKKALRKIQEKERNDKDKKHQAREQVRVQGRAGSLEEGIEQ